MAMVLWWRWLRDGENLVSEIWNQQTESTPWHLPPWHQPTIIHKCGKLLQIKWHKDFWGDNDGDFFHIWKTCHIFFENCCFSKERWIELHIFLVYLILIWLDMKWRDIHAWKSKTGYVSELTENLWKIDTDKSEQYVCVLVTLRKAVYIDTQLQTIPYIGQYWIFSPQKNKWAKKMKPMRTTRRITG